MRNVLLIDLAGDTHEVKMDKDATFIGAIMIWDEEKQVDRVFRYEQLSTTEMKLVFKEVHHAYVPFGVSL
jgi:hypothetical protein